MKFSEFVYYSDLLSLRYLFESDVCFMPYFMFLLTENIEVGIHNLVWN